MRVDRDSVNEENEEAPIRIGRYRLLKQVGEGAFAKVYFARDEETQAPVARKVLRDDIDPSNAEQVRVRVLAEERISKAIDHRYVVEISETSEPEARPCFLAMDFIQGRSFCQYLQRLKDPEQVLVESARLGHGKLNVAEKVPWTRGAVSC
jgi:serine/threonine-protein kinase